MIYDYVITKPNLDDALEHFGVKGMKWKKRKGRKKEDLKSKLLWMDSRIMNKGSRMESEKFQKTLDNTKKRVMGVKKAKRMSGMIKRAKKVNGSK